MSIPDIYKLYSEHSVISTDSRNCPAGCLFFALRGDNFNANAFALSALENGAGYAIVDESEYAIDQRFILVDNVLETLQQLANYHRMQLGTIVIGITGTNGKTTSKELIAAVLSQKFNILFTQGNLNNHIGVPLTLLKMRPEHEIAVVEMGASHKGDIQLLAEIACPDYGIITNVGKAHLEGFGSFEGVKQTKSELYVNIYQKGKKIFINTGNDFLMEMALKSGFSNDERLVKYKLISESSNELVSGMVISCSPFLKMQCATNKLNSFTVETKLIGSYNAENVLAAVTIGHFFEIDDSKIKAALEQYTPQNNRSQLTVTERNKLVVDAYNANPTSMHAAIQNFGLMEVEQKLLILGDMLELGEQADKEHQQIVELLESFQLHNVLLVGKLFSKTKNQFNCFETVDDLIQYIEKQDITNNYILIKGSRGIKLEKVIPML